MHYYAAPASAADKPFVARSENRELVLSVAKSNFQARRFYDRNGFVVTGEGGRSYRGTTVEYLQMKSQADTANAQLQPARG